MKYAPALVIGNNHSGVKEAAVVNQDIISGEVEVRFLDMPVLCVKRKSQTEVKIYRLNLNVFGFSIVGDESGMRIGGLEFKNNVFRDIDAGIVIG